MNYDEMALALLQISPWVEKSGGAVGAVVRPRESRTKRSK